jgi:hypothetical protein
MGSHRDEDSLLSPKLLGEMREVAMKEGLAQRERSLMRRMEEATEKGTNLITAGMDGEQVLFDKAARGILVRRLPDDPDDVLRISIGCPAWDHQQAYCVIRGNPAAIYDLLRRSVKVLQSMLPELTTLTTPEEPEAK